MIRAIASSFPRYQILKVSVKRERNTVNDGFGKNSGLWKEGPLRWTRCGRIPKPSEIRGIRQSPVESVIYPPHQGVYPVWLTASPGDMMDPHGFRWTWECSQCCCSPCFQGSTCQFTTSYYSISIEAILFAHLQSKRITVIIIITSLVGTIGNILFIATFCQATAREMGSGIYRLWITIIGQLGTMALATRLFLISNQRNTGIIECFGLDYLISVLPPLYYSSTACLSVERVFVAYGWIHRDPTTFWKFFS